MNYRFTKGKWITEHQDDGSIYIESIGIDGEETYAARICRMHGIYGEDLSDAEAICTAMNETFMKGYDPAAMESLVKTVESLIAYCDNEFDVESKTIIEAKAALAAAILSPKKAPKTYTIGELDDQPTPVLVSYIEYVDNKTGIDELPLSFDQWAELEVDQKSPVGKEIIIRK